MAWLYATVMGAENPGFQIGKDQVDHWQVHVGHLWIPEDIKRLVLVTKGWQFRIGAPAVGANGCSLDDVFCNEREQVFTVHTLDYPEPNSPGINELFQRDSAFMVFAMFRATSFGIFAQADFDGSDDNGFIVATLSALRRPA